MRVRSYIRSGMSPFKAHRKGLNNSHLKEKDIKALPNYLNWKKSNTIQNNPSYGGGKSKTIIITIKGKKFVLKTDKKNKKIGDVYDLDSYKAAKKSGVNPILIGKIVPKQNNPNETKFIPIDLLPQL